MKYLEFYNKYAPDGHLPNWGLCGSFKNDELFKLIDPENGEFISYWAYSGELDFRLEDADDDEIHYRFTPFRETIVLLMAAMNGEL